MAGESFLLQGIVNNGPWALLFVVLFLYTIREHKARETALMEELRECRHERVIWLAEINKISKSQDKTADTQRETAETMRRIEVWLHNAGSARERTLQ